MSKTRTNKDYIKHRIKVQQEYVQNSSYFCDAIPEKNRMPIVNDCLFKSTRQYVPELHDNAAKSIEELQAQLRFALTINRNLQSKYGYSMDQELLTEFAKSSVEDQKEEYAKLITTMDEVLGVKDFNNSRLFYPGFPEEVMEKSDAELYATAFLYYLGTYGMGISDFAQVMADAGLISKEAPERTPLVEVFDRPVKYINKATEKDFHELMKQRIHGNGLNAANRDLLLKYAATWKSDFLNAVPGPYKSKENEALVASWLHDHGHDSVILSNHLCKDATDILRVISVISQKNGARNGRITRDEEFNKVAESPERLLTPKSFEVRLSKDDKKFVKTLMNNCKNLFRDMWTQEPYWKEVMRNIDARKGPAKVVQAFNNLANGIQKDEHGMLVQTQNAEFVRAKEAMKNKDNIEPMISFAHKNPGYFLQHCVNVMTIASEDQKIPLMSALTDVAAQVDPSTALKTYNAVGLREKLTSRVIRNHSKVLQKTDTDPVKLNAQDSQNMRTAISYGLKKALEQMPSFGKVYIDPKLNDVKVPQRQDVKGSDGATVSTASRIPGSKDKNLILAGISWKTDDLDLDLHATPISDICDLSEVVVEQSITWRNLRTPWGLHSGDFTSGDPFEDGKGAQEFVVIDKSLAKKYNIDYILFDVYGYNAGLNTDDSIRTLFMEREGSLSDLPYKFKRGTRPVFCGEVVEPSTFEESVKLQAKGDSVIMFAYDVQKDNFIWLDEPLLPSRTRGFYGLDGDNSAKCLALLHAIQNPEPTMGQLFMAYAEATNSEIVDDITQADHVFTYKPIDAVEAHLKENAITINSMQKEQIYEDYCVKLDRNPLTANRPFSLEKPDVVKHAESKHNLEKQKVSELSH